MDVSFRAGSLDDLDSLYHGKTAWTSPFFHPLKKLVGMEFQVETMVKFKSDIHLFSKEMPVKLDDFHLFGR